MKHSCVERRGEQVIGGGDGVDVAGQVEIELFHWNNLAVTASGGSAFDAKRRALAGLAHAGEDSLAQVRAESLAEADSGGGLSFPERCWGNRRNHNVPAVRHVLQSLANRKVHLSFVFAVELQLLGKNA